MGNTMKLVIGLIAIAIAFIVFPIVLDGIATVLADVNLADYTGLEAVVSVTPLLVWVSLLFTGGLLTFQALKGGVGRGKKGGRSLR